MLFLAIGIAIRDSCFCLAHYLLADKYRTIALTLPYQANGADFESSKKIVEKQKCLKCSHYFLFFCNIFFPVLNSIFVFIFALQVLKDHRKAGDTMLVFITITSSLVGIIQVVSRIILIQFVLRIRAFFKS